MRQIRNRSRYNHFYVHRCYPQLYRITFTKSSWLSSCVIEVTSVCLQFLLSCLLALKGVRFRNLLKDSNRVNFNALKLLILRLPCPFCCRFVWSLQEMPNSRSLSDLKTDDYHFEGKLVLNFLVMWYPIFLGVSVIKEYLGGYSRLPPFPLKKFPDFSFIFSIFLLFFPDYNWKPWSLSWTEQPSATINNVIVPRGTHIYNLQTSDFTMTIWLRNNESRYAC